MARQQHGVLARRDLLALGFSEKAIRHRIATGRLRPLWRGVYAVGWTPLTPEGRWMAATLACGDGAALSHRSAAALWGIGREDGLVDVTIRRRGKVRRAGIRVHRRPALPARTIVCRRRIPVTSVVQTLVDALRTLLDRHTFRLSDSDLEIFFRPLALAAGFPLPMSKQWVLGYEVDFWFPDHGLVVETDGLRYHRTAAQQAQAAKRDQVHVAAGLRVVRFTHRQIAHERASVIDVLGLIRGLG